MPYIVNACGLQLNCVCVFVHECLKLNLWILKHKSTIVSYSQYGLVVNYDNSLTEQELHTWDSKI